MSDPKRGACGDLRPLGVEETRARIAAAAPPFFEAAPSPASEAWSEASAALRVLPRWAVEAGAIRLGRPDGGEAGDVPEGREGPILVWLAPGGGGGRKLGAEAFPSELVLEVSRGRRTISTWDCGKRAIVGTETGSGPTLVLGPPFDGAPLVLLVREPWAGGGAPL
ncbi:MAG: hypothetical protein JNG85_00450 [Spirochaetaceae bacterium]|nr:hypothetical protein [Spirochaetaceae bacterium]